MSTESTTTIAVTGAAGHLGRLAIEGLIASGHPADKIVGVVRNPAKAEALAARGVDIRTADYTDVAALEAAFAGVDSVLLVSGSEVGQRLAQHTNVITAAQTAGVRRLVYTSLLEADTSTLALAGEHVATEMVLADSPLAVTILRNGWYWENYAADADTAAKTGTLQGAVNDGRVAGAARADYADAAVAVLTGTGHEGKIYELAGDEHLTYPELAAAIGAARGTTVTYTNLTGAELTAALLAAGLDEGTAGFVAGLDAGIARGDLDTDSTDLHDLIGRSSTPAAKVLAG